MSHKVVGILKIKVIFDCDVPVHQVIENMDYSIEPDPSQGSLVDSEIIDFDILDSK